MSDPSQIFNESPVKGGPGFATGPGSCQLTGIPIKGGSDHIHNLGAPLRSHALHSSSNVRQGRSSSHSSPSSSQSSFLRGQNESELQWVEGRRSFVN
jgi:hypothetical protein